MPSLQVMEVAKPHTFENATTTAPNETVGADNDDDDKTEEMSDNDSSNVVDMPCKDDKPVVTEDSEEGTKDQPPPASSTSVGVHVTAAAKQAAPSSASKKRRVTPTETPNDKKRQQKKVSQMNLSSFFHKMAPGQKQLAASLPSKAVGGAAKSRKPSSPASHSAAPTKTKTKKKTIAPPPVQPQTTKESEGESMDVEESSSDQAEPSSNAAASEESSTNSPVGGDAKPAKPMTATDSLQDLPVPSSDDGKENVIVSEADAVVAAAPKVPKTSRKAAPAKRKKVVKKTAAAAVTSKAKTSSTEASSVDQEVVEIDQTAGNDDKSDTTPPEEPVQELSEDRKVLLQKHSDMKKRCHQRFEELVQVAREGIDEEDFDMPPIEAKTDLSSEEDFPDVVVNNMALLVEGSTLPLSELASMVCNKLQEGHQKEWSEDSISTKIKLIAERKPYAESASAFKNDVVGKYEDTSIDRMWRWEFGIVEVLPSAILSKVRKARTARRKVLNHYMTNQRLLKSLEDADSVVRDMKTQKLDSVIGKIGKDEEKVLKFDREAEKQRLAQLATRKKDQELEAKRKEKELKKEEAEKKRLEKEKEKQEAVEARDAEKRKKTEVKERQEQEKKQKEQQKKQLLNRQKACLMSFFANPAPKESKDTAEQSQAADTVDKDANKGDSTDNEFNPSHFRSLIDSQAPSQQSRPLFSSLSKSAVRSRKRRTRKIPVSVYVTVIPESNGFDEQPFAEQQIIHIPNKYRFLSFHEDYRPPYHGTWSKQSKVITGRTPLNKDTTNLDYDYDSEGEWEEGDDEIGEDVDDDAKNQEEEEEEEVAAKVYDYDDGFCVADDQYLDIDEDVDEETKALYKKKLQRGDEAAITANRICIIGPVMGGKPPSDNSVPELMEGFDKDEATELLAAHTSKQLCQDLLWLDAFAPDKIDELDPAAETEKPPSTASSSKQEHTVEEMKALALFAHHCTLNSKDKLIEELRNANPDAFVSRAAATRKLDSIAEKKKHPSGTGVYWEVNKQVLEELQLSDILAKKLPVVEATATETKAPAKQAKKKSSPDAPAADAKTSVKPSKKRKSSESSSTSSSKPAVVASTKPTVETQDSGTPKIKTKSPIKQPASSVASAAAMMNFLQPRKKIKGNAAANTEAEKP